MKKRTRGCGKVAKKLRKNAAWLGIRLTQLVINFAGYDKGIAHSVEIII